MLLNECAASKVDIRTSHRIADVSKSDRFRVTTDRVEFEADAVVLATGGLSIPRMGATGLAHDVARRFGLTTSDIRPGLVPLTFDGETLECYGPSAAYRLNALSVPQVSFREALLFTHRGLSGPEYMISLSGATGRRFF